MTHVSKAQLTKLLVVALFLVIGASARGQFEIVPFEGPEDRPTGNSDDSKGEKQAVDTGPAEFPRDANVEKTDLAFLGEGFRVIYTPHFAIFHNVSDAELKGFKVASEKTYISSVKYVQRLGISPRYPRTKLHAYFFSTEEQFRNCARSFGEGSSLGDGRFFLSRNRSAFFDLKNKKKAGQAEGAPSEAIDRLKKQLEKAKTPAERQSIQKQLVTEREKEKTSKAYANEWNTVLLQHELAHQVLFNIGFHTQLGTPTNPRWFVEGTALMLESTGNGKASNMGAVNHLRLRDYRKNEKDGKTIDLVEIISSDSVFNNAATMMPAYNTTWALTHYLNRTKRDRIRVYAEIINKRDAGYRSTPAQEREAFEKAFGKLDDKWIQNWKDWMKKVG